MNELVIPPAANWFSCSILTCTPDNTVIYGSRKDIVVISPKDPSEAADVRIITVAHQDNVLAVSANNNTWGNPNKYVVSAGEDGVIKLWDMNTFTLKLYHKGHEKHSDKLVGVSVAGERIVSVTENGHIIVWRYTQDTWVQLPDIFNQRVKVKFMSSCPHVAWRTAFGLASGLVIVADLRQTGKVLYKMRAHNDEITGLSWCPTPRNIYKTTAGKIIDNLLKMKSLKSKYVAKDEVTKSSEESYTDKDETSLPLPVQIEQQKNDLLVAAEETDTNSLEICATTNVEESSETEINKPKLNTSEIEEIITPQHIEDELFCSAVNICMPSEQPEEESEVEKVDAKKKYAEQKIDKRNPWGNVEFHDSDEESDTTESVQQMDNKDFLQECKNLKKLLETDAGDSIENVVENDSIIESDAKITLKSVEPEETQYLLEQSKNLKKELEVGAGDSIENVVENDSINESVAKALESSDFVQACENLKKILEASIGDSVENESINESVVKNELQEEELIINKTISTDICIQEQDKDVNIKETDGRVVFSPNEEFAVENTDNTFSADEEKGESPQLYSQDSNCTEDDENVVEHLLASACKGGMICIWRAATDGRMQLQLSALNYQQRPGNKKKRDDKRHRWIALCWAKPYILLSSSSINELYVWNMLPVPEKLKKMSKSTLFKPRLVHGDHSRSIFTIAVPYRLYPFEENEDNWRTEEDVRAWTVSRDKWLLCTSLNKSRHVYASYPCIGGTVICIAVSPLDPNRLAIGASDAVIGLLDLSRSQTQQLSMQRLWDKVKSRVTALSWHPTLENYIAFATSEGRIGEYDVCKLSKPPVIFSNFHRHTVHKLQWGPLLDAEDGIYGIYSCSNFELIIHDASKPLQEPKKLFPDIKVTNFLWKPDYTLLAVGNREGHVKLFNKRLELLETLYMTTKTIFGFAWHPIATVTDNGESPCANDLAVAANEEDIYVYRCSTDATKASEVIAILQGHVDGVKTLDWCPHISGRLVSASEDGTSIVWDVSSQEAIAYYKGVCKDSILATCWSPLDADLIIAGGKDCTLRFWRITKSPVPENFVELKTANNAKTLATASNAKESKKRAPTEKGSLELNVKLNPFPNRSKSMDGVYVLKKCEKLLEELERNLTETDVADASNISDSESVARSSFGDPMQLLDSRDDVLSFINYEQSENIKSKSWNSSIYLGLMKGDIAKTINIAKETNALNPWIVGLAPMASHDLWMEVCAIYADQLRENGQAQLSASYYLACHKVNNAIEVLCDNHFYKEALALAHCRFPEGDNIINSVIEKWLRFARHNGNYELAAAILIKQGNLSEAGEMLNKRYDIPTLELVAKLAERGNNTSLRAAVSLKLETLKKLEVKIEKEVNSPAINIHASRFDALMANQDKSMNMKLGSLETQDQVKDEEDRPSTTINESQLDAILPNQHESIFEDADKSESKTDACEINANGVDN